MQGREVAWRTLAQEPVEEPCIAQFLVMKGDYFSRLSGRDYWADRSRCHTDATAGALLFLNGFGQADFMGPYSRWGYVPYLRALAL